MEQDNAPLFFAWVGHGAENDNYQRGEGMSKQCVPNKSALAIAVRACLRGASHPRRGALAMSVAAAGLQFTTLGSTALAQFAGWVSRVTVNLKGLQRSSPVRRGSPDSTERKRMIFGRWATICRE